MRIAFDAKRAAQNRTGLGNYSRFVIRILQRYYPDDMQLLYVPNPRKTQYLGSDLTSSGRVSLRFPQGFWKRLRSLWRVWGVTADTKREGCDVFHGLSNELPLNVRKAGCRKVVTIHDLIFIHCPEYYHWIDRKVYDFKFRRACRNADVVVAVSEYTKREIMRYYGTPEHKIRVVYQGCDPAFAATVPQEKADEVRCRYQLPSRFVLYVGSIEKRKNLMLVAKAFAESRELQASGLKVVAVGKRTAYTDEIIRYLCAKGIDNRFLFFHNVPFADLPSFYCSATVFVYPSRIEGFGIPLLEAITAGVPAIGCTGSCLEEAGGPDSIYVNPDDYHAMAQAIIRVANDPVQRKSMTDKGKAYARRFSDETLARQLREIYIK